MTSKLSKMHFGKAIRIIYDIPSSQSTVSVYSFSFMATRDLIRISKLLETAAVTNKIFQNWSSLFRPLTRSLMATDVPSKCFEHMYMLHEVKWTIHSNTLSSSSFGNWFQRCQTRSKRMMETRNSSLRCSIQVHTTSYSLVNHST